MCVRMDTIESPWVTCIKSYINTEAWTVAESIMSDTLSELSGDSSHEEGISDSAEKREERHLE